MSFYAQNKILIEELNRYFLKDKIRNKSPLINLSYRNYRIFSQSRKLRILFSNSTESKYKSVTTNKKNFNNEIISS